MKKSVQLAVLTAVFVAGNANARVIYGEDNRKEVFEATPFQQKLAQSAATMVSEKEMTRDSSRPGLVQFSQRSLREWLEAAVNGEKARKGLFSHKVQEAAKAGISFCEGEKFVEQANPGMCSGFLIAPDLIVTAGHCVDLPSFCSEYRWVFDFKVDQETKKAGIDIKEENIYKCKKVVSNALSMSLGLDYAIVQLDRKVKDREPLEIRNDDQVANDTNLLVIGSPSGLPLKVAAGAKVRKNAHPFYFSANLDAFQGNSGSAVFNAETGTVEGILVRGEEDFVPNQLKQCVEAKKCKDEDCRGEDITRMTAIPEVGVQVALNQAAFSGDMVNLEKILKLNIWVDFYTKDGVTALMKAVQGGKKAAVDALIAKGADVNLQDSLGNSSVHHLAKKLNVKIESVLSSLTTAGAKLEAKNANGETALIVAAKANNLTGAKLLIKAGAEKNALDMNGDSVATIFLKAGNRSAANELVKLGVSSQVASK